MDEHILARHKAAMEKFSLDAMVAYSTDNVGYGLGYLIQSQVLGTRNRQFAVAVNKDGMTGALLTSNEAVEAQTRSLIKDLRPYDEFADDPMAVLAGLLKDLGVAEGRIGLEMDAIPADRWEDLKRHLPRAKWEHGAEAYHFARMVKTPMELDRMRRASRIADLAQAKAHPHVKAGVTEREVYRRVVDEAIVQGADRVLMVQVAAGERSAFSNPTPSDYKLQKGEVVKIDVFVEVGGYLSDHGKGFVVGEASQLQKDIWARMQETQATILSAVRPGATTLDLWRVFVETFDKHGMKPVIRFLGHGLGLSLHEEPFIASHMETELLEGMVFAVEPVYKSGGMGFHLEDNLIVTKDGVENMSNLFGPDLMVLG